MKNTFGNNVSITLFGESHGEGIGAVLDGVAPGISVDTEFIKSQLSLRRPSGAISTARSEKDAFKILSGVYNGKTTGTPIAIVILNEDTKSKDYSSIEDLLRPGHADFTANEKYHGYQDKRGGGHFSGRITAPLVACGAILISALKNKGIHIGTHIKECGGIKDREFCENIFEDITKVNEREFGVLNIDIEEAMKQRILDAKNDGDSVGGILETAITGVPSGVGEPWFDSFEGVLSHILFSIPAIKGVEFGAGFDMAKMTGSEANDSFFVEDGKIVTKTNSNGGINGGISNGMPIIFRCAVKPTPTIFKPQETVNIKTMKEEIIQPKGRHDPAIIHRARVVVDSVVAIALCDMLQTKFGTDYLGD